MPTEETSASQLAGIDYAYGGDSVIACAIIFIVLCTTFLGLRFISIKIGQRHIGIEDWLLLPAWVIEIGLCANVICSVVYGGVGRHEAYVLAFEPHALMSWAQTLFVTEVIYGIVFPIEKTTILLLYLRLFRIHRWFRFTTYFLIAYIWLWGISEVLVAIFQCQPIAYQWNKALDGSCIDQLGYYRWVSVPNVVHDVFMLIIPIPVVWNLQVELRQKLALTFVFLIGSIGCVASFIRLNIFFRLNALSDNTWASIQLQSWTLAETGVILISACLPALWPLVLRIVSRPSSGTNRTEDTEARQNRGNELWGRSRQGLMADGDDSIPLKDTADRAVIV
ncbi:hypothetical protein HD806DRAFT_355400 [Xylariaceae sp. AK1471]|nr:hypothetical protein HD806DRAFT_355400 [Xylariaceae sp. AK1471]